MEETKDLRQGVIYKYTSPSNKHYIGQTINENIRKSHHRITTAKNGTKFGNAISKYGLENFSYEILFTSEWTSDLTALKEELDSMEIYYIDKFHSFDYGYNLTKGGEGTLGYHHSEESKEKISKASKNSSKETRRKISQRNKGRIVSKETREKISKSSIGKKMSKESRQKMSDSQKGKVYSEEQIQKFRDSAKNKKIVYQYDKNNTLLNIFSSCSEAARILNLDSSAISKVCRNKLKTTGGYIFKYELI